MATRDPSVISMMGPRMACRKLLASFIGCLRGGCGSVVGDLRASRKPFVKHIRTQTNQSHRPVTDDLADAQDIQIVQEKEYSHRNQNRGSQRKTGRTAGARHNTGKLIHWLAQ